MSVEEYTRVFKKLLIKCNIQEPEDQTIVRYLGGLDPKYANVVELQQYSTFDKVCVLDYKVEQPRKAQPYKHELSRPFPQSKPFNKESSNPLPKPMVPSPSTPQRTQPLQKGLPPQTRPNPSPISTRRCLKC